MPDSRENQPSSSSSSWKSSRSSWEITSPAAWGSNISAGRCQTDIRTPEETRHAWPAHALVVVHSDGLETRWGPQRLLPVLVLAPIAIPEILMGVSLLIFFVLLNFTLGLVSVALAHIAFCIGFVAIVVRARLAGMDEALTEAARDCGATPLEAFRYITLPLIMPGVIAGALMAFTLSIDDFVITFFTAGAGTVTLPLQIYSMIKIAVTPEVNAVSTLLMLLTLVLIIVASKLSPNLLRSD